MKMTCEKSSIWNRLASLRKAIVLMVVICILHSLTTTQASRHKGPSHHHVKTPKPTIYLNEFAVDVPGGIMVANAVAKRYGFINTGPVEELEDWYIFTNRRLRKRSVEFGNRQNYNIKLLKGAKEVLYVERLQKLYRVKRDAVPIPNRSPNDPSWNDMWYMHCGEGNSSVCPCSMRVLDAWRAGYTGKGVVTTILDDGIEKNHPDLVPNYDPLASRDINDGDNDPTPRYDPLNENKHGTRCAGVVAAVQDNYICSVGIAYGSKIGGVRMLDGEVTDRVEARSLNFALDHIDIYSASWGPDDDGTTVEGPGLLAKAAFKNGARRGRRGRGAVYIWASGNGGHNKDSCSCDGYINSIYTIGISSVSQYGYRPWYLEGCASTLATTYSSGDVFEGKVITTDLRSTCTHQHTGTSASAPMAAGVVALMLQANTNLTWRDVQHIIVRTSNSRGLHAPDWVVNGAGYNVSHVFGFGLLDAAALTHVAKSWVEVPAQRECVNPPQRLNNEEISFHRFVTVSMDTRACFRQPNEIAYLEHVILRVTLTHPRRGDLQIFLQSPSGTVSNILERRDFDRSKIGFREWEFMTTHHWGENPMGVWELEIRDHPKSLRHRDASRRGMLQQWQLIFFGTKTHPQPDFNYSNCEAFPQDHCHPECDGCCGATSRDCTRCRHVRTVHGECIASCATRQYIEPSNNMCKHCWRSCLTCNDGSPHNCTSCHPGYAIVNGACVKTCSPGYFLEASTQNCMICDELCKTCQHRSSRCTSCRPGFVFESGNCRPSCPTGTYLVSISAGCRVCNQSCKRCIGSPNRCTACAGNYVLFRERCTQACPDRYFPDFHRRTCRRCHSSCRQCNGPRRGECTMCHGSRQLSMGQCLDVCRDDYNVDIMNNPCMLVLRLQWCHMPIFSSACCHTCESFRIFTESSGDLLYEGDFDSTSSGNETISNSTSSASNTTNTPN
uniref:Furin-like protease kpc-1 n=1 Tax=Phallusia mammillata TaxID=59560 RepID=A0A6F9DMR2_9ASCI|nr:furin-like protease kpc-1 [Phallusia mammillata]